MRFENCVINELSLHECTLVGVTFRNCFFNDAKLYNIVMDTVRATDCTFEKLIWSNDKWEGEKSDIDYIETSKLGEEVPDEIANPSWLQNQDIEAHHLRIQDAQPETDCSNHKNHETIPDWVPCGVEYPINPNWPGSDSYLNTFEPPVKPALRSTEVAPKARRHFTQWESIQVPAMSHEARTVARAGQFPFLDLDQDIRERIYKLLLQAPGLRIADVPLGYKGPAIPNHQLRYTMVEKLGSGRQSIYRSTYIAGSNMNDRKTTSIDTTILRTNKQAWQEGAGVLYGQIVYFTGTAEGALSWLHDVSRYLDLVKTLVFTYRSHQTKLDLGPRLGVVTFTKSSIDAFARLCNAMVHKCEGLNYFGLIVDDKFWSTHNHRKGAEYVFKSQRYLQHIARLAQYDRTSARSKASNNGVHIQLHVEGTNTPAKERFIAMLEQVIQEKRAGRPKLAVKRECNGCKTQSYEDCCFVKLPESERVDCED